MKKGEKNLTVQFQQKSQGDGYKENIHINLPFIKKSKKHTSVMWLFDMVMFRSWTVNIKFGLYIFYFVTNFCEKILKMFVSFRFFKT